MKRDGDIIKALGFVALYAAYVEESIDTVMNRLSEVKTVTDKERRLPASQKIDWCLSALASFKSDKLGSLIGQLEAAKILLERRNKIIHGRIYAGNDRNDNLKSGRKGEPDRDITADELYDLAEELLKAQATIPNVNSIATLHAIAGH